MSQEEKNQISRRGFLKGLAAGSAGLAGAGLLSGCQGGSSSAGVPSKWDEEVDVVVVGTGFAGLAAAIEAHNEGAVVKILEKMSVPGGNSTINGGAVAYVGSPEQEAAGIEDSVDLMYNDMLVAGLYLNYPENARIVAENCAAAVQWSMDYLGVEYTGSLTQFGGHSVPRSYSTAVGTGYGVIKQELAKVDELGIDMSLKCQVSKIFRNEEGRAVGVEYVRTDSNEVVAIKASKAVILAYGGFGQDLKFRQTQDPRLTDELDCTNQAGATAEMLQASLEIGALPVQLDQIQLGPWASPDEKGFGLVPWFSVPAGSPWGIIVDPETGERFVNELTDRKRKADAILEVGHPTINICDAVGFGRVPPSWDLSPAVESGVIFEAETLEELAEHYDIPVDTLLETVEKYNSYVETGVDPDFDKPIPPTAEPLTTAPFYGARLWPKVHHCMGGIAINGEAQVLDLYSEVIPGLYAAGEAAGGTHGATRLGSVATADCLVFGRIAGRNAAAEEAWS